MLAKSLFLLSVLAAFPAFAAETPGGCVQDAIEQAGNTGGQSYGDRNRGGPYGFYSYPRHRHVDAGTSRLDRRPFSSSAGTSPYDNSHGSAYYGRDYGAPYFGGGYYDKGTYYRERRER